MRNLPVEIVAPAGDLESGLYALEAGAGGVYFGLPRFSARRSAVNLSFGDVRRLKGHAVKHGARIYAAVNTVITQAEMGSLTSWINELVLAQVDGIVVQDLGLAAMLRQQFPQLPLHGSTQMGVHNKEGLAAAMSLGLRRVVLSRELSLKEIRDMAQQSPDVEREVFVHGALCYGFSGLCLASSQITGRSGNRGHCAQICRTWFNREQDKGFYFSSKDLDAGDLVGALSSLGVRALKIEGRMKSAGYVYNTVAYYRALLDGDKDKAAHHRERSAVCFARPGSHGFLRQKRTNALVHVAYPSHVGVPGATVLSVDKGRLEIRALTNLAARDRLMRLPQAPPDEGDSFVLSQFSGGAKGLKTIDAGQTAFIEGRPGVHAGMTLMKTFSHDMYLKALKKEAFPEYRKMLPLAVQVDRDALLLRTEILGIVVERSYAVAVEPGREEGGFIKALASRLRGYGDYPFGFDPIEVIGNSGAQGPTLFIPPSALKQIRGTFFKDVRDALLGISPPETDIHDLSEWAHPLPPREEIVYPDGFPFLAPGAFWPAARWPLIDGTRYLALAPVLFDVSRTVDFAADQIAGHPDERFAVGLSNVGHLTVAQEWRRFQNVSFFVDYGIYAANTRTLGTACNRVEGLVGAYLWLEANQEQRDALAEAIRGQIGFMPPGLRFVDRPRIFPQFISRSCFKREQNAGVCPGNCDKSYSFALNQGNTRFEAVVKDCLTYLFLRDR